MVGTTHWPDVNTTFEFATLFGSNGKLTLSRDGHCASATSAGFSNSAVDRRFSTPVATAVDGNLPKVVENIV